MGVVYIWLAHDFRHRYDRLTSRTLHYYLCVIPVDIHPVQPIVDLQYYNRQLSSFRQKVSCRVAACVSPPFSDQLFRHFFWHRFCIFAVVTGIASAMYERPAGP